MITVDGSLSSQADYDVVYFDDGGAVYEAGNRSTQIDLGSATLLTMTGNNNASISVPTDEAPKLMKMIWLKAN